MIMVGKSIRQIWVNMVSMSIVFGILLITIYCIIFLLPKDHVFRLFVPLNLDINNLYDQFVFYMLKL